ncbi:unnamed protein product [Urochloa decumbens]|uniref:Glyoxal oxidase N-terminal domain-containing protein n=1 Tax=Urochloa decumbens TaxID=240449 RepID=A0ABC9GM02_9POAL
MGFSLPPRRGLAVALLLLASSGEAFFDMFRQPVDSEYFTNAFDGSQEPAAPVRTEQEEKGAAPATATGLTRCAQTRPAKQGRAGHGGAPPRDTNGGPHRRVDHRERELRRVGHAHGHHAQRPRRHVRHGHHGQGRSCGSPQDNCRIDPARQGGRHHGLLGALGGVRLQHRRPPAPQDPYRHVVLVGLLRRGRQPGADRRGGGTPRSCRSPDGRYIMFGGRRAFSYELVPMPGRTNDRATYMPFLRQTTDEAENNLYPFVNLLPSGNLFLFANNRSVIFDHRAGKIVRELPQLGGGSRNYPASAMSALLPLDLRNVTGDPDPVVVICGGALRTAFRFGENNTFLPALRDCSRINLASPDAQWDSEDMPVGRVMGDMLVLPTGDLLLLSGAAKGCAGWASGGNPCSPPVLYSPRKEKGPQVPGSGIVHHLAGVPPLHTAPCCPTPRCSWRGGNTNPAYNFSGVDFPTRCASSASARRGCATGDVKVTMYAPPFTTHGYSMNQRLLILSVTAFREERRSYTVTVDAPGKPELAPRGYYLVFVVAKGVPSKGVWGEDPVRFSSPDDPWLDA